MTQTVHGARLVPSPKNVCRGINLRQMRGRQTDREARAACYYPQQDRALDDIWLCQVAQMTFGWLPSPSRCAGYVIVYYAGRVHAWKQPGRGKPRGAESLKETTQLARQGQREAREPPFLACDPGLDLLCPWGSKGPGITGHRPATPGGSVHSVGTALPRPGSISPREWLNGVAVTARPLRATGEHNMSGKFPR